jgi:hypothetical protein
VQVSGDAEAKTVQVFPVSNVPALSYAWTVNESVAPEVVPETAAAATVIATVVFPALTAETVGAAGATIFHFAYKVVFA